MTTIIADDDVKRLLPMAECIEAMRVAFRDFANGIAVNRPRMRVIREDQVHELGDILIGKVAIAQPARGEPGKAVIYFKNNSGLAIQFAAAGGILYRKAIVQANNKTIPIEWLGSDLSAYYNAGLLPPDWRPIR